MWVLNNIYNSFIIIIFHLYSEFDPLRIVDMSVSSSLKFDASNTKAITMTTRELTLSQRNPNPRPIETQDYNLYKKTISLF